MVVASELITSVTQVIQDIGKPIIVYNFTSSFSGADYDIEYITKAGSAVGSGAFFPIDAGGNDAKYYQQGTVKLDDSKLFTTVLVNSNSKIVAGGSIYDVLPDGIKQYGVVGSPIYSKIFVRFLNLGSFVGEI